MTQRPPRDRVVAPHVRAWGSWFSAAPCALAILAIAGCYTGLPAGGRGAFAGAAEDTGGSDDGVPVGDDATSSSGAPPATEDTGALGSSGGSESSGGEPVDDPDAPRIAAVDISPAGLQVNQGVAIDLAEGGTPIPGGTRTAAVLHDRPTLVTATWVTDVAFAPRTIQAALHLVHADGTEETFTDHVGVDGTPSGHGPTEPHAAWTLAADAVSPGTRWSVTLHELAPTPDGLPDPGAPRLPATGLGELDDAPGNQRIRVVLIPFRHQYDGCDRLAPSDESIIDGHRRAMEMQYPTQQVEITLHPEYVFSGAPVGGLDEALVRVLDLRAAEAPEPDVYYYGLVWPCDEATNGGLGYLPNAPTTIEDSPYRSAVGVYYDFALDFTFETMVHEIGHNHGRPHVACAGTEGDGTDPNYPIAGGAIGVLGWGIHDQVLRPATHADFMSYCTDLWASPYSWNQTLTVIDALGAVVGAAPPPEATDGAVMVVIRDGEIVTATRIPHHTPRRNEGLVRWTMTDGSVTWTTLQRDLVPDSDADYFTVAMPGPELDAIELAEIDTEGASTLRLDRAAIATR